jgi:hypothetical protein
VSDLDWTVAARGVADQARYVQTLIDKAGMGKPPERKPRRRPPATIVLRTQTEKQFQETVKKLARFWGWCGFHISFSHGAVSGVHLLGLGDDHYDSNGFPDWVFVRDRILFRELKTQRGTVSSDQKRWRRKLEAAGADYEVWRPGDEEKVADTFSGRRVT